MARPRTAAAPGAYVIHREDLTAGEVDAIEGVPVVASWMRRCGSPTTASRLAVAR